MNGHGQWLSVTGATYLACVFHVFPCYRAENIQTSILRQYLQHRRGPAIFYTPYDLVYFIWSILEWRGFRVCVYCDSLFNGLRAAAGEYLSPDK